MKLQGRIPYVKMLSTLFVLQFMGIAFVFFRENWLLDIAQGFIWVALLLMGVMLFSQRKAVWGTNLHAAKTHPLLPVLKNIGLFLFFVLFIWQISYLSLYESQPLMYTEDVLPIRYDISPGDLLGFTLRLALQTWVLALALALVFNKLPKNGEFGFIRGNYKKLSTMAWYISNMLGAAVTLVLLFSLSLLVLDVGKFISKGAGSDVMNVPQFSMVVFLLSLYLFNIATGFGKRLKLWGESANTSVVFIMLMQLGFVLVVYCLYSAMMHFLPPDTVYALMQPFYLEFLNPESYPVYWQLFVTGLSFFIVPLLAHYFYHACQGERVLTSVTRLLVIPAGLVLACLQLIPYAQNFFWQWMPTVSMYSVELNNLTSRYEITWVSYFSVLILLALMLMLNRSKHLVQSLVDIMPEQVGRRERRVKAFYARAYPFIVSLLAMYLIAGVVISLYFTSIFLMAAILGMGLCFVAGLKRQEA